MFCSIGYESTLFVFVLTITANRFELIDDGVLNWIEAIQGCLKEKLPLLPHPKLVIINDPSRMISPGKIPPETLQVFLPRRIGLGTMLELLNKRYKSLDLIAVMLELKRACLEIPLGEDVWYSIHKVQVHESLSCLPRIQKVEQM